MESLENFSDAPLSVAEIRAARESKASLWKPRDVLIDALRQLDKGEINPESLVVVWREKCPENGVYGTHYTISVPEYHIAIGMLERSIYLLHKGAGNE